MIKELYNLKNNSPDAYWWGLPPTKTDATIAFGLCAKDILANELDYTKDLHQDLDLTNGLLAEILLRELICMHLNHKVAQIIDWEQVKRQFASNVAKIPFDTFPAEFKKYENKLRVIAKLKLCTELLKSLKNSESLDLDTANYLLVIYHKLSQLNIDSKIENSITLATPNRDKHYNTLLDSNIYNYLSSASLETLNSNINELMNFPIDLLIDELFNHIIIEQFEFANMVLDWPGYPPVEEFNKIMKLFRGPRYSDDSDYTDTAIIKAEQHFDKWLIDQMHILDDNKTF